MTFITPCLSGVTVRYMTLLAPPPHDIMYGPPTEMKKDFISERLSYYDN